MKYQKYLLMAQKAFCALQRRRQSCSMRLNNRAMRIFYVLFTLIANGKRPDDGGGTPPRTNTGALACGPRLIMNMDRPQLLWPLFGQSGNDVTPTYDKETERRSHWTTIDWLQKHKYAVELHNVTTSDGYQLLLHRLPKPGRQPVLLVHGLFTSSLSWVLMGPDKSLAFQLYDKNYDVWLANLRGSPYGRGHVHLNVSNAEYWNYSFHELGAYDLPAIIDRIRDVSSFHQLLLIGHSQAFNAFLVMCALHPAYNERILLMQALAPIVELRDYVKFQSDDVRNVMRFVRSKLKSTTHEFLPAGYVREKCLRRNSDDRQQCLRLMKTFAGSGQHTTALEPLLFGQLLQGGAPKEVKHLQQLWDSGDFVAFDYGVVDNQVYYNAVEPYNYRLQEVSAPMILHFGASDAFATPEGVHRIYARLLEKVIGVYRVAADRFNHMDFLCANDVKTLVNDKVIELMEKHLAHKLSYVIE